MIPALLTCAFVIYLYRTLNAEPEAASSLASIGDAASLSQLADRLAKLEQCLRVLDNESSSGRAES